MPSGLFLKERITQPLQNSEMTFDQHKLYSNYNNQITLLPPLDRILEVIDSKDLQPHYR